jgi:hypothetical protein
MNAISKIIDTEVLNMYETQTSQEETNVTRILRKYEAGF